MFSDCRVNQVRGLKELPVGRNEGLYKFSSHRMAVKPALSHRFSDMNASVSLSSASVEHLSFIVDMCFFYQYFVGL